MIDTRSRDESVNSKRAIFDVFLTLKITFDGYEKFLKSLDTRALIWMRDTSVHARQAQFIVKQYLKEEDATDAWSEQKGGDMSSRDYLTFRDGRNVSENDSQVSLFFMSCVVVLSLLETVMHQDRRAHHGPTSTSTKTISENQCC